MWEIGLLHEAEPEHQFEKCYSRFSQCLRVQFQVSGSAREYEQFNMSNWIEIAKVADVAVGSGKELTVGDRIVALFNVDGQFHAIDGICAHAGGPVGDGELSGCIVTCPWHGWQYDVSTGAMCLNDQIRLESFPVKVEGDSVLVEMS